MLARTQASQVQIEDPVPNIQNARPKLPPSTSLCSSPTMPRSATSRFHHFFIKLFSTGFSKSFIDEYTALLSPRYTKRPGEL